jgi:hypothetical protein
MSGWNISLSISLPFPVQSASGLPTNPGRRLRQLSMREERARYFFEISSALFTEKAGKTSLTILVYSIFNERTSPSSFFSLLIKT